MTLFDSFWGFVLQSSCGSLQNFDISPMQSWKCQHKPIMRCAGRTKLDNRTLLCMANLSFVRMHGLFRVCMQLCLHTALTPIFCICLRVCVLLRRFAAWQPTSSDRVQPRALARCSFATPSPFRVDSHDFLTFARHRLQQVCAAAERQHLQSFPMLGVASTHWLPGWCDP